MLKVAIIVFREMLEIALIVSILIVATRGLKGRNKFIIAGIVLGIAGSVLLAFFTNTISDLFDGVGQEVFNASILLISSSMIAWTVIWMTKHGKAISANLKKLGKSVVDGEASLFALTTIVAFTVLREGAEIVLFSYGSFVSGDNVFDLILGATIGLSCGLIAGFSLYYGLIKVLGRHFFSITSWLLIFLAAGMVSGAIGFLSHARLVPEIIYPIWDSSALLSEQGFLGKVLHAMFGYISKPSLAQLIGYLSVILALSLGLKYSKSKR
jgi:high-affinity iron transporter